MASEKMIKALNEQINAEMYSAYLYLSMGAFFEAKNLDGFGKWMKMQALEEMSHAMKFYGYINDAGGQVVLDAIEKPPADFGSPLQAFEEVLKHEKLVTSLINKLVDLAITESDHATRAMLQWFVTEQVEEEAHASSLVEQLRMFSEAPQAIFMMNKELGLRPMPALTATAGSAD